jgi:hypothetical protein
MKTNAQPFFYVRREKRYEQVWYDEIVYVKARRGLVQIVCEQRTLLVLNTLTVTMKYLPQDKFCRIHHSYAVPFGRIRCFDKTYVELKEPPPGSNFKPGLTAETRLPMGGIYRKAFRSQLNVLRYKAGSPIETKLDFVLELEKEEFEIELGDK